MYFLKAKHKKGVFGLIGCGSVVGNILKSPGYPTGYPNNMDCNYWVHIPHDRVMKINFVHFDVENASSCR